MKATQILILDASSFTAKSGNAAYLFQCCHYDRFEHLKAEGVFVSEKVFKEYSGPGVYDAEFSFGGGVSAIVKKSNVVF